jgi:hypothetical protein
VPYLVRHYPTGRDVTVPTVGALHTLLTGWFAGSDVEDLLDVDDLCLAVEQGEARNHLQVRLGLSIDRLDPRED